MKKYLYGALIALAACGYAFTFHQTSARIDAQLNTLKEAEPKQLVGITPTHISENKADLCGLSSVDCD